MNTTPQPHRRQGKSDAEQQGTKAEKAVLLCLKLHKQFVELEELRRDVCLPGKVSLLKVLNQLQIKGFIEFEVRDGVLGFEFNHSK